ncbi:MAG: hypothetical protein KatS3mg057_3045 [Herpetosiphonaceae bacterium]|nr:MAG: hypothetical protein KatS3mg057_3045 [Herpetosiphonaceae bacterium]
MCGIVGYVGPREATEVVIGGLQRLEYRGYDSAGIAILNGSDFLIRRSVGKLHHLTTRLRNEPTSGQQGIGHTRWATPRGSDRRKRTPHTAMPAAISSSSRTALWKTTSISRAA